MLNNSAFIHVVKYSLNEIISIYINICLIEETIENMILNCGI